MSDTHRKHTQPKEYGRRRPLDKDGRKPLPLKCGKHARADDKRRWRRDEEV